MKYSLIPVLLCMVITGFAQNVGIGTNSPQWPLHLVANVDGIAFRIENNHPLGSSGLWVNVRGEEGAAINARAENPNGTAAPVPFGAYAIRGVAGDSKNAIGAFATNGIAVRAVSGANGLAISSSGSIRLAGIGEGAGKVLVSDASGNATWQNLQASNFGGWSITGNAGITNANFIGTTGETALRFRTNNSERMLIYPDGTIAIGTTAATTSKLEVYSENTSFAAVEATNLSPDAKSAIFGRTRNAQSGGAVYGFAIQDGSGLPTIGNGVYAVMGEGMGSNRGVGAFSFSGTALFAHSNTGLALHTSGGVRLAGIGESAGKLLVSDANGNATWQNPVKITVDQSGAAGLPSLEFRNGGTYRGAFGWSQTDGRFFFYDGESNTNALFINNGRIGIGNRNPTTNTLEVNGTASKSTAGDWLANSDARLKKDIQPLQGALQKLQQLNGITYQWNDDKTGNERPAGNQIGFTAQNIQKVFPELVSTDAQGYLQTAYGTYDAVYVEAIKELLQKIMLLEKRLAALEK